MATRPGEARTLKWGDIEFSEKCFTVQRTYTDNKIRETTKSKRKNTLPLLPEAEELLISVKPDIHNHNDFVFLNPNRKTPWAYTDSSMFQAWKAAREKAGFPDITMHVAFRHSFASQRVNEGTSMDLIGAVLNHSDRRTTQQYAHANLEGKLKGLRGHNGGKKEVAKVIPLKTKL